MQMTSANWITVVLALVGILANLGFFLLTRLAKTVDEFKQALSGENGSVARLHGRIDKLGEIYQTREATEMQFEHLRAYMDTWRSDSERRHQENLARLNDLKEQAKEDSDTVKHDVRALRSHVDELARPPK